MDRRHASPKPLVRTLTLTALLLVPLTGVLAQTPTPASYVFEAEPLAGARELPLLSLAEAEAASAARWLLPQLDPAQTARAQTLAGSVMQSGPGTLSADDYRLLQQFAADKVAANDGDGASSLLAALLAQPPADPLVHTELLLAAARVERDLGRSTAAHEFMAQYYDLEEARLGKESPALAGPLQTMGTWNTGFVANPARALRLLKADYVSLLKQGGPGSDSNVSVNPAAPAGTDPRYTLLLGESNYLRAIQHLASTGNYGDPALDEMERALLGNFLLQTHLTSLPDEPDFFLTTSRQETGSRTNTRAADISKDPAYDKGAAAIQRRLNYMDRNAARTVEGVASVLLEDADWDLLYERRREARQKYEEASTFFSTSAPFQPLLDANVLPVSLPVWLPAPNSRAKLGIAPDAELAWFASFDVSFSIDAAGRARKLDILEQRGEVSRDLEIRFRRYFNDQIFRPRHVAGELDDEPLRLRYYVGL